MSLVTMQCHFLCGRALNVERENQINRTNDQIVFINIAQVSSPETSRNTMNRVPMSKLGGQVAGSSAMDSDVKPYRWNAVNKR